MTKASLPPDFIWGFATARYLPSSAYLLQLTNHLLLVIRLRVGLPKMGEDPLYGIPSVRYRARLQMARLEILLVIRIIGLAKTLLF